MSEKSEQKEHPDQDDKPTPSPVGAPEQPVDNAVESVSLLDLMDHAAQEQAAREPHPSSPASSDDEATPTGPPIPAIVPRKSSGAVPPPLYPKSSTFTSPPPPKDRDATRVQPRIAFPGSTEPLSETPSNRSSAGSIREEPPQQARAPEREQSAQDHRLVQRHMAPPRRAFRHRQDRPFTVDPEAGSAAAPAAPPVADRRTMAKRKRRNWGSCFIRLTAIGLMLVLAGIFLSGAAAAVGYATLTSDLPSPQELESRTSTFETAIIYDREGNELYSLADPNAGNRTYITLDQISPYLLQATIATEDARFYSNPGFDPASIARAIFQATQEGEIVSGASTITQQLVRALLLDEQERTELTFRRKVREIVLAAELSRVYPGRAGKDKILELYLNEINYGNRAYGIEAAAQTYFDKSALDLNLSEASLLAGLPQRPAVWDPFTNPELALNRQSQVLGLMAQQGYITPGEAQAALNESALVVRDLTPPQLVIQSPHFVFTVLQQLEDEFGAQAIYQGGFRVFTTLDPDAQNTAEEALREHRNNANSLGANNGAIVVLEPNNGEVLALVGSFDFTDEAIRGQVNMALAPRQPGSSIKPLVYLSAMEQGWTPASLIWDVSTEFPDGANPPYEPKNFDDTFHGPVLLRSALGNSYNIPAVKALEYVGVCPFIENMQKLGLASLLDAGCLEAGQPGESGLSLALGGKEVSPLDMAAAFGALANGGHSVAPFTISHIENSRGDRLFTREPTNPADHQVIRPAHAFLLNHILSDDDARQPEFGPNSPLVVPNQTVAVKTGTSGSSAEDTRDGWTIGYTPQVVAAVWVGNTDAEPVARGASGFRLAAPIWNQFMTRFLAGKGRLEFLQPASVVPIDICADSGARPGPTCRERKVEYFAADQLPLGSDAAFIQRLPIDHWTNLIANSNCQEAVVEVNFANLLVTGRPEVIQRETIGARRWVEQTGAGMNWADERGVSLPLRFAPTQACREDTPRPQAVVKGPPPNQQLQGEIDILGAANGPGFDSYQLDFGLGHAPESWTPIQERRFEPVVDGLLGRWDTAEVTGAGPVTLRLQLFGPDNPYSAEHDPVTLEVRVPLFLVEPTPTPTNTPTITPTPTETATPTETPSPTSTATPEAGTSPTGTPASPSPTPSETPVTSEPPAPSPTSTPDDYP